MSKSLASSNRLTPACPSRNFAGPVALANQPSISGAPALAGNRPLEPRALEVEFFPMEEVLHEKVKIH
jgi:hypothetical protein